MLNLITKRENYRQNDDGGVLGLGSDNMLEGWGAHYYELGVVDGS